MSLSKKLEHKKIAKLKPFENLKKILLFDISTG